MFHYVYELTAPNGEFYIGVRSSSKEPMRDRYMGSGRWCRAMALEGVRLTKRVLSTHHDRRDAGLAELAAITEKWGDPLLMNRIQAGGTGYLTANGDRNIHSYPVWREGTLQVKVLWTLLRANASEDGLVWISRGMLVHFSGMSEAEFDEAMAFLLERGYAEPFEETPCFQLCNLYGCPKETQPNVR
jgi:hypothetical protein